MPKSKAASPTPDPLLAAVREEVLNYGVRRATLTSVAARAGVSRMTVYRRGGSMEGLVLEAVGEEFAALLREARAQAQGATARERLVGAALHAIAALSQAPLTTALRRHDPDLLLPYLVDRHGSNQNRIRAVLEDFIREGQADGSVRPIAPAAASLVLLHAVQDFVISSEIVTRELAWPELSAELAHLLNGYLAPFLTASPETAC